jgi:hypothetical protein
VTIDTNRYSVPAQLAGGALTVKMYPDRLCFYHDNKLVARHVRSYDRRQDYEHPDHPKALLAHRRKAKDQKIFMRFLSLSDKAQEYYRQMEQRRMNPFHHIRQIVALSEIYPEEKYGEPLRMLVILKPSPVIILPIFWNSDPDRSKNRVHST